MQHCKVDEATYTKVYINSFNTFRLRLHQKTDCIPLLPCCEIHNYLFYTSHLSVSSNASYFLETKKSHGWNGMSFGM